MSWHRRARSASTGRCVLVGDRNALGMRLEEAASRQTSGDTSADLRTSDDPGGIEREEERAGRGFELRCRDLDAGRAGADVLDDRVTQRTGGLAEHASTERQGPRREEVNGNL